jgi:hypothetical protein
MSWEGKPAAASRSRASPWPQDWSLRSDRPKAFRQALKEAFPGLAVDVLPDGDHLATLFVVHEGATLRHQLRAPRRILDDARARNQPLAQLVARAVAMMRRVGADVVKLQLSRR